LVATCICAQRNDALALDRYETILNWRAIDWENDARLQ
jgi:hypothetical protein